MQFRNSGKLSAIKLALIECCVNLKTGYYSKCLPMWSPLIIHHWYNAIHLLKNEAAIKQSFQCLILILLCLNKIIEQETIQGFSIIEQSSELFLCVCMEQELIKSYSAREGYCKIYSELFQLIQNWLNAASRWLCLGLSSLSLCLDLQSKHKN